MRHHNNDKNGNEHEKEKIQTTADISKLGETLSQLLQLQNWLIIKNLLILSERGLNSEQNKLPKHLFVDRD